MLVQLNQISDFTCLLTCSNRFFCIWLTNRLHYEISLESTSTAPTPLTLSCQYSQYGSSPNGPSSPSEISMKVGSAGFFNSSPHGVPGLPQPPRQKGRPRKRKPKDIESMTANLGKT